MYCIADFKEQFAEHYPFTTKIKVFFKILRQGVPRKRGIK